jgi:hypothetical protein
MNEQRKPPGHMQNSVWVGGSAANIQNVHGDGAYASMDVQPAVADSIETLRMLLRSASIASEVRDSYERALAEVEAARRAGPRGMRSAKKAMEILATAATAISGWTEALEALRHAIPGL